MRMINFDAWIEKNKRTIKKAVPTLCFFGILMIMVILAFVLIVSVLSLLSFGLEYRANIPNPVKKEKTINNMIRVFYHNSNQYSFLIKKEDRIVPTRKFEPRMLVIKDDVPNDMMMWYRLEKKFKHSRDWDTLEIHIHSEKDIQGGSWNKHLGRGMTETGNTNVLR